MASATAAHQPLRIVSRRAQLLLQRKRGGTGSSNAAPKRAAPKVDETPWPQSLRYAFYTVCVISVPLSIGQAIAQSPRLRAWMVGDDVEEVDDGNNSNSGGLSSSNKVISFVRNYWGHEDYVPPIDRPQFKHVSPGHRNEWQDDNYTSLLAMFGLYSPPQKAGVSSSEEDGDVVHDVVIPMSFDNEPRYHTRHDQMMLQKYLSPKINSGGVKTKLALLPCKDMDTANNNNNFAQDSIEDTAGYENECTLPGNMSMNTLRAICQGSDAQCVKRDLAESDPNFQSKQTDERIRTRSWNEDCRWAVSFADSDDKEEEKIDDGMVNINDLMKVEGMNSSSGGSSSEDAAKVLRHSTAINSRCKDCSIKLRRWRRS